MWQWWHMTWHTYTATCSTLVLILSFVWCVSKIGLPLAFSCAG